MAGHFIDDGYTTSGYLEPSGETGCPALNFQYRPALANKYEWAEEKGIGPDERTRRRSVVIHEHLVSWDAVNSKGQDVSVSLASVSRLHWLTMVSMFNIICGLRESDQKANDAGN